MARRAVLDGRSEGPLADPRRGCDLPRFFLNVRRHGTLIADREGDELPDVHAVLASIRDTLRAGLAPLHAVEGQAPYDAGPAGA